ncbi:MAG TPA: proline dehydrogenase family protein [Actinomycetota bacterium]|nr:proline dehydrogenase family protein [Actinomycetota bacterium]
MLTRSLMAVSENPRIRSLIEDHRLSRPVVDRFVAGAGLEDAVRAIAKMNRSGIGGILDLLGEGVTNPQGASEAADEYLASIKRIEETGIDTTVSIKLTQLGLAFDKAGCIDYVHRLATEAKSIGTYIEIDMEQSDFVGDTIDVYRTLRADFDDIRLAMQAYLRRTPADLQAMADLHPKVRLIKGAYSEPPEVAVQKKGEIDAQFAWLTDWLIANGRDPAIGTHDGKLIDHCISTARRSGVGKDGFEVQLLYGIRRDLQQRLAAEGYRTRVYVPFGSAWYPYLMRRMAERPANLRFFLRALAGD